MATPLAEHAPSVTAEHHSASDSPRILIAVEDADNRATLVRALEDTGYDVVVASTPASYEASLGEYDLVLADMALARDGSVPTLLVPDPFDVVDIEMLVLDLLGWDGPPTLRRIPAWVLSS